MNIESWRMQVGGVRKESDGACVERGSSLGDSSSTVGRNDPAGNRRAGSTEDLGSPEDFGYMSLFSRYRGSRIAICLISCVLGLYFFGRTIPNVDAKESNKSDIYEELKVFTDVLAIVQRDYVQEIEGKKAVEGAIKGLLATLDPHSGYLDPSYYQDLQVQTKGEFGGLGIEITVKDGILVVVSPMEGSPAAKAGVKPGDAIVKIQGEFTKQFTIVDAVKALRGPKGTPITITVHREGSPDLIDLTIVRDTIKVDSVRYRDLGDGFGYIRITQFMERTGNDLQKALEALHDKAPDKNIRGLILDLRNNPGGLLNQAIRVADFFLREGVIVYTDGRVENQKQKFFATERGTEPDYPIIVLVNGGSASASEIVAGALKDHGRALILGTRTFGKGSVQTITPLSNGGALTLTTALYYTKSGNSIQATGVEPDIEVEGSKPTTDEEEEPTTKKGLQLREGDLPGALKNPDGIENKIKTIGEKEGKKHAKDSKEPVEEANVAKWIAADPQLQRAYDLLKTFGVFGVIKPERN